MIRTDLLAHALNVLDRLGGGEAYDSPHVIDESHPDGAELRARMNHALAEAANIRRAIGPVVTYAQLEAAARAHDAEDSAQRGEPSPWREEGDGFATFKADRISAMRRGFEALGFTVEQNGYETAARAMNLSDAHLVEVSTAMANMRAKDRITVTEARAIAEHLPGFGKALAQALEETGWSSALNRLKKEKVPAEPTLSRVDALLKEAFSR